MLFQKPRNVLSYAKDQEALLKVLECVATDRPKIYPVFECVKVWCKLDSTGVVLFARNSEDVLAGGRLPSEVVSKFKSDKIRKEAYDILCTASECLPSRWPFFEGSSSWVLLEVLSPVFANKATKNKKTVIFRESARLSYLRGRVSSPMSEKTFQHMEKHFTYKSINFSSRPSAPLDSSSGRGFLTEARNNDTLTEKDIKTFSKNIIEYNKNVISSLTFPQHGMCGELSAMTGFDVLFEGDFVRFTFESVNEVVSDKNEKDKFLEQFMIDPIWRM